MLLISISHFSLPPPPQGGSYMAQRPIKGSLWNRLPEWVPEGLLLQTDMHLNYLGS